MKKLLSLAVALLCSLPTWAGAGTDTFNCDNAGIPTQDTKSGNWTGSTGAVYDYNEILNWWCVNMNTNRNSIITVATPAEGCVIRTIYRNNGYQNTLMNVYVSDSPITVDNLASATLSGTVAAYGTFQVPGEYSYFAITPQSGEAYADSFEFTWAEAGSGGGGGEEPSNEDHITAATLQAQNPDGNFSATGYSDHSAANPTFAFNGVTGAQYELKQVISDGSWWTLDWDYPYDKGTVNTLASGGYIMSVEFDMDWTPEYISFYVSENPIDPASPWTGAKSVYLYKEGGKLPKWETDGIYKYFFCDAAQEKINDLSITWSDEAPAVPCQTPYINCYSQVAGSSVSVYNPMDGANLHVNVYVNGVIDTTLSVETEERSYDFDLPGVAGDEVKIEAWVTKEGYLDSEVETKIITLELPQVSYLFVEPSWDLVPGMKINISTSTEGATIVYSYGVYQSNNGEPGEAVFQSGELTGPSPVEFTIPEEGVTAGMIFKLDAVAKCEGYKDSYPQNIQQTLGSNVLPAPSFSPESGAELQAGQSVTVTKVYPATTLHYTVNGGEEQTTTEYSVSIPVTGDMTIEAWQTGDAPYKQSEKVTANYKLEVLGENIDAIYPALYTNEQSVPYTVFEPYKSDKTNISYQYNGAMTYRSYEETECFYLDYASSDDAFSILYNIDNPKDRAIKRFKIESPVSYSACYIMFSQDAPITEVSDAMKDYDFDGPRLRINESGSDSFKFGEWVDLSTLDPYDYGEGFENAKYFSIWRFGQNVYLSRILIEYEDDFSGIKGIETENGVEAIYDLNGMKVNSLENATPGVYIRIVNGKSEKVLVK